MTIATFMAEDHARLGALLRQAERTDGTIDEEPFEAFRRGLLRHIGMEEKILLPLCREKLGEPLAWAAKLRADHGRIAKLLVPTPTVALVAEIRAVLAEHDALEETTVYPAIAALVDDEEAVLARLRAQPDPPLAKHYDGPLLRR